MLTRANVKFISCKQDKFVNKAGETIHWQKVSFLSDDDVETMNLNATKDCDFSIFNRFDDVSIDVNFYVDARSGYLKGKIVGIA